MVTVLIIAVIVNAMKVVLRPESLLLSVDRGTVFMKMALPDLLKATWPLQQKRPYPTFRKHQCWRFIDTTTGIEKKYTVAGEPPELAH